MATLSTERLQSAARKEASWIVGACQQFFTDRCPSLAASIAFYSAFSLAPTLVMVIAVAGWFFGDDTARGQLYQQVQHVLGTDAAAGITTIVENAHRAGHAGGIAAVISFSMLVVGASATFSSLNTALNIVWPPNGPRTSTVLALVRVRLISFSLVLGVAFLLIVSLVLDTTITFVGQWLLGSSRYLFVGNLVQLAVGLLVLSVAFAALLKLLPDTSVLWRDAIVGGLVAAVLFSTGKKLFALYLAHAGMATTFGAAGSLAVLLMWLYFSAAVLLLGAEFSAARARQHDPRGASGFLDDAPPGSRAKLASVLAASTIAAVPHAPRRGAQNARIDGGKYSDEVLPTHGLSAARNAELAPVAVGQAHRDPAVTGLAPALADGPTDVIKKAGITDAKGIGPAASNRSAKPGIRRMVSRAENSATYTAAATLLRAGRTAVATDRYVRNHPWRAVFIAASAALAMTAATTRYRNAHRDPD